MTFYCVNNIYNLLFLNSSKKKIALIKYIIILFLFFLIPFTSFSNHISGVISDNNGEPLPFASIYIKNSTYGVSSNAFGEYFIELEPGSYTIVFSYIGYKNLEKAVTLINNPLKLNIVLRGGYNESLIIGSGLYPFYTVTVYGSKKLNNYSVITS